MVSSKIKKNIYSDYDGLHWLISNSIFLQGSVNFFEIFGKKNELVDGRKGVK